MLVFAFAIVVTKTGGGLRAGEPLLGPCLSTEIYEKNEASLKLDQSKSHGTEKLQTYLSMER